MHRDDLMKPDLLCEILVLAGGVLLESGQDLGS
jgi:hypothetical protein